MPARKKDLVADLGELGLASRLKRLSDQLFRDVAHVYRGLDVDFQPRWFPLTRALLDGELRRPVTELARELGLTHPAINQLAGAMERAGLLRAQADPKDGRRRLLSLTARGRRTAARLEAVWEEIREANRKFLDEVRADGADLMAALEASERRLEARGMRERVTEGLRSRDDPEAVPAERLEIVPYRPAWRGRFEALNREWLEPLFGVEPHDAATLSDPYKRIVKPGGTVLFARMDGEIIGTGALLRHSRDLFEIAKIAVTAAHRRRGIGGRLVRALIDEARTRGAGRLYLETSPRLIAARRWYERLGFRHTDRHPRGASPYARRSIVLTLDLEPKNPSKEI